MSRKKIIYSRHAHLTKNKQTLQLVAMNKEVYALNNKQMWGNR